MQYQTYLDNKKSFEIAFKIGKHKIAHTYNLLNELARYYKEVVAAEVEKVCAAEKKNFENGMQSAANLLNYEGRIATFYWSILTKIFSCG